MTVLTAPERMRGRDQARRFLSDLPRDLSENGVVFSVLDGSLPTASFIDQIVSDVLVLRNAARLTVLTASQAAASAARDSAESLGVADRLVVVDELDIASVEEGAVPF